MLLQEMNKDSLITSRVEVQSIDEGMSKPIACYAVVLSGDPRSERDVECLAAYRNGQWSLT